MQHRLLSSQRSNIRASVPRESVLRRSESILLYGLGLALTLSLAFNGYLLREQSHRQHLGYDYGGPVQPEQAVSVTVWQQQLSDCARANEQKDSLIRWLEHLPESSARQPAVVHREQANSPLTP